MAELSPALSDLMKQHQLVLPQISAARKTSREKSELLSRELREFNVPNCSLVAFGSLARCEFTAESDLDWTLLVDGPARSQHKELAIEIGRKVKDLDIKAPNPSGAFQSLTFSHDLVHAIGGDADTNKNTTKRILLLLESIDLVDGVAWNRVVRGVLDRYFTREPYGSRQFANKQFFPRFLLNDIVRFWRTMAVDYAAKVVDRGGDGWALRNAKLRMSRKLLFTAGLLMSYEVHLEPPTVQFEADLFGEVQPKRSSLSPFIEKMVPLVRACPLDILARAMIKWGASVEVIKRTFEAYDQFLELLNDQERREHLNKLPYEKSLKDPAFNDVREISEAFQHGLNGFFLDGPDRIRELTLKYAIF